MLHIGKILIYNSICLSLDFGHWQISISRLSGSTKSCFQNTNESAIGVLGGAARNLRGRGKKLWHEINAFSSQHIFVWPSKNSVQQNHTYKGVCSLRNSLGWGLQLRVEAVLPPTAPECHCHWSGSNTILVFWVTPSHLRQWKLKVSFGTSILIEFLSLEILVFVLFYHA